MRLEIISSPIRQTFEDLSWEKTSYPETACLRERSFRDVTEMKCRHLKWVSFYILTVLIHSRRKIPEVLTNSLGRRESPILRRRGSSKQEVSASKMPSQSLEQCLNTKGLNEDNRRKFSPSVGESIQSLDVACGQWIVRWAGISYPGLYFGLRTDSLWPIREEL